MPGEYPIWNALRGALVTRALGLVAQARVAEALSAGPRACDEIARERGVDANTLHRVLRALASDGIFEETEAGVFANTPASELLKLDGSRGFAELFGGPWFTAVASLELDGEPSFAGVHGNDFWTWLDFHPSRRAAFDSAMAEGSPARLERLQQLSWVGDELVVDVGGGNGALLSALVNSHPQMRGIVFDLASTVRDQSIFSDRCVFEAGSFFESVPHGDVHLLCGIIHDWDDDSASRILKTVRNAGGSRLIVFDSVIEPGNATDGAKWLDLLMLVIAGGRERTAEQWQALLSDSGWHATRIDHTAIEAEPR